MNDDAELLRRYADEGAEDAFAALVQRHVNLVYSVALRQLNGDAHFAADATQAVFIDLARKARSLASHRVLAGWLFTSARFAAAKLVRSEQRRHAREQEAQHMQQLDQDEAGAPVVWERVRPVLDDVIGGLNEHDREAILLRFYEGRDYASVGAQLNVADNTARMRVERALDKLRAALEQRGVTSSSAALATALANQAVFAAPAGLTATVTGAALATGGLGMGAAIGTAAAGATTFAKLQLGVSGAVAAAVATGLIWQTNTNDQLRAEIAALQRDQTALISLQKENRKIAGEIAEAAELRRDDTAFAQLQGEATALQTQLQKVLRAEEAAAAAARRRSTAVFDISKVDRLPQPRFQARPEFPMELRQAGKRGDVIVDFIVDTKGDVQNAHAVRSTDPVFDAYAVEAVRKWKFTPGQKGGREVNTHLQVPIVFTLAAEQPPQASPTAVNAPAPSSAKSTADPFVVEARRP